MVNKKRGKLQNKSAKRAAPATRSKVAQGGPLDESEHYVLTLRLPPDLNLALERYISKHSEKQRQKKKVIVHALKVFLHSEGELP